MDGEGVFLNLRVWVSGMEAGQRHPIPVLITTAGPRPGCSRPHAIPFPRSRIVGALHLTPAWSSRARLAARMHAPRPWQPPPDLRQTSEHRVLVAAVRSDSP
ncbi:hypothetical protein GW17_00044485 [Ensete ventricosum]|nr:hypothetical protein GW17_00044485 [Ensete ventricosum]